MQISKMQLQTSLDKVKSAVGAKDNNMQQDCFTFMEDRIMAFNDDVAICTQLDKDLGNFAVSAKEFYAVVQKLPGEVLDMELTDEGLIIKSGRSKSKFKVQKDLKFPIDEIGGEIKIDNDLPEKFAHAMSLVAPACGRDMTKPLTTCVFLKDDCIVATDNYCAARYIFDDFQWKESLYLPRATADIISKYALEGYSVQKQGWIRFGTVDGTTTLDCRTYYKGQPFADIETLFEQRGDQIQLPEKLIGALERAGVFGQSSETVANSKDDPFVNLSITNNSLVVSGTGSIGEYEEKMRIEYDSQSRSFFINANLLSKVLKEGYDCELCQNFIHIGNDIYGYLVAYTIAK